MKIRRLPLAAAVLGLALCAPKTARATEYRDAVDDFSAHIDPPGFIACVTWPAEGWDRVDCDGLSQPFEAGVRAALPRDVILTGSSVHRSDTWGFRVQVMRLPWEAPPLNETEEGPYLERVRALVATQVADAKLAVGPGGFDVRMEAIGNVHAVRIAYDTTGDPLESVVELAILGAEATHGMVLVGPKNRARDLDAIAGRALQSVRLHPAPRHPPVLVILGALALGVFGFGGTLVLLGRLAGTRRKRRPSAVDWPSTRRQNAGE